MDDITIIIKTLDRYVCLKPLIKSILKKYKDIPILIGDDSLISCKKRIEKDFPNKKNIIVYNLPYDCGLSYGRNYLVNKVKTKYFCLCDDDFVFDKKTNLEAALNILKENNLDILGGYLRNYKIINSKKDYLIRFAQKILHYELPTNYIATLNEKDNILHANYQIKEFPDYKEVDVVINFFIAKTESIKKHPWDEDLKLQEHTAFFYSAKKKGLKIGFTNKLSIRHCPIQNFKYKNYRTRNYTHVFMEKNNLKKIVSNYDNKPTQEITIPTVDNIFISVIVPVYNVNNKADLLIKSLKEQTYKNFEVILVDNNSTDGSKEYLKKLINDDKRFTILSEKRQGPNYARQKGFSKSKGEYIYFADADDYLEDDTLYHFICEITKNKSDIVIGDYIEHSGEDRKLMKGINKDYKDNLKDHKDIMLIKLPLWNKIFKKEFITNNSFIYTFISEDILITALAMAKCNKITYISKPIYHYIFAEGGLTSTITYDKLVNIIESHKLIKRKFEEEKLYDKYKEELEYIFITHTIYRMFRITMLKNKKDKEKAYEEFLIHLKKFNKKNKYLKKSKSFKIAYKVVSHKSLFKLFSPSIKMLFTNKKMNKIFKKLDR